MVIVETGIDSRPKDFGEEVVGVFEDVGMNSVGENQAVHDNAHVRGAEITFNQLGKRTGDTGMCCRIFRMVWRNAQGRPGSIGGQLSVSASSRDRCNRSPKAIVILAV